jgi:hypothetical protein
MQLRDYQERAAVQGLDILRRLHIVYLVMEVRTGKTLTALTIAQRYGAQRVLFLTKKKAIASVQNDYEKFGFDFELIVINDESLHKVEGDFDLLIRDEHHRSGGFPEPGKATVQIKQRYSHLPMIFLSGTPAPETWTQIYHQFWVSDYSPFKRWPRFHRGRRETAWAHEFVNVCKLDYGRGPVNDYTRAREAKIIDHINPYLVRLSQAQAGFKSKITEHFIKVHMSPRTERICHLLETQHVVQGKTNCISADTAVSLQQKLHQLWSGTIIFDKIDPAQADADRARAVIDDSKARVIQNRWGSAKIAIFYVYKHELAAIQSVLKGRVTTDIDEFKATDKSIALQIVSGREGVNLSEAEALVFYNISFSATSYWQARDRMTTADRAESQVYWLFAHGGIEEKIYAAVANKKKYTVRMFKRDYGFSERRQIA